MKCWNSYFSFSYWSKFGQSKSKRQWLSLLHVTASILKVRWCSCVYCILEKHLLKQQQDFAKNFLNESLLWTFLNDSWLYSNSFLFSFSESIILRSSFCCYFVYLLFLSIWSYLLIGKILLLYLYANYYLLLLLLDCVFVKKLLNNFVSGCYDLLICSNLFATIWGYYITYEWLLAINYSPMSSLGLILFWFFILSLIFCLLDLLMLSWWIED